ncbi:hypothetical protein EXIGLDRAFT_828343 [Exidia glandulosa HHB12029]|uniref:Uncharacterized protein n=1 Tax=Exidia glandulosa HHB12029 TaxID=1314781 RepID=A0A165QCI5_EXIGL|nr:hypothetical protein EXIGLDRAFT_828343 [Exidia glandulosa HHB12029]
MHDNASDLRLERSYFAGMMLASLAHGLYLTMAGICAYLLYSPGPTTKPNRKLLTYVFALSISATVFWIGSWCWGDMILIDIGPRNYPGGPVGFVRNDNNVWASTLSNAAMMVNTILADGLLLWRSVIIWDRSKVVLTVGIILYIGDIVCGCLLLYHVSTVPESNSNPSTAEHNPGPYPTVDYTIPWLALTLTFNLIFTLIIVGKLLWHRRNLRRAFGPDANYHRKTYTSRVAMLVESAALYSLTTIVLIAAFASGIDAVLVWLLFGEIACIAPMLILLRVAMGRAYGGGAGSTSTAPSTTSVSVAFACPVAASRGHNSDEKSKI